jgi:PAT family beta-lactamase induction signal transducer AmpG
VIKPYFARESLAAFFVGISSGFPYAMIGATLTTRLAQDGIDKRAITAFALAFLVYNLKPLWAWVVDGVRLPLIVRLGQRVSWMIFSGLLVIAATFNLAFVDPAASLQATIVAAVLLGLAGATYDIVIDAYRIETLQPHQLGIGAGMSQYGWRIGSAAAGAVALLVAAREGWSAAYMVCAAFALPAMLTALMIGEPFREFLQRPGAALVLAFVLVHKVGDTLANLTFRLLFDDLGYTNDEIAIYDVGVGFWAFLIGIFVGGLIFGRWGLQRSVLLALVLMAASNLSFAGLAAVGHSNLGLAAAIGFENFASGYGGVVVVAYFSALCNLRFTAAQYALISAAASVIGRVLTGTTAGSLIESMGYVDFYLLTTLAALPGVFLFLFMMRRGLVEESLGSAGRSQS